MQNDTTQLRNRLTDLAARAEAQCIYTHSPFLSPEEQAVFLSLAQTFPIGARLDGGSGSAIRKIAVFGSEADLGYAFESPIRVIRISPRAEKFAAALSHRDYLGALMGLGIDRATTGDIVVRGKEAWLFALDSIAEYIVAHLDQVGRTDVICNCVSDNVPDLAPQFEHISGNVASERLDLILAAAIGGGRESVKRLQKEGRVFLNGQAASSPGHHIKTGDVFVVRGHGKFIYDGISATTRKSRCNISIRKYV